MLSATAMFPSTLYLVQAEGMQLSDGVDSNWIDGLKAFTKKMKNVVEQCPSTKSPTTTGWRGSILR